METKRAIPFRRLLIAGAVASMGGFSGAALAVSDGYAYGRYNEPVVSRYNDCVRTGFWNPSDATAQCDPELVRVQAEPMQAQPEEQPMELITLDTDTLFDFDEATLTAEGRQELDRIVQAMEGTENPRVRITGHADRIGPEDYNLQLSRERARAVADYLARNGIPQDAIMTVARGEANPVVSCEGISGQQLIECLRPNRRSEVEFAAFEPAGAAEQPAEQLRDPGISPEEESEGMRQRPGVNPPSESRTYRPQ